MIKKLLCFVSIILLFVQTPIYASTEEVYYTNNYGMPFTEYQYNIMVEKLSEDTVANLTYEEYNIFRVSSITEDSYSQVTYDETTDSNAKATYHETSCKKITIAKGCSSTYCLIDLTTIWKCIPAVKSYDITGIRLSNTNFYSDRYSMYAKLNGSLEEEDGSLGASNGLGFAFKIPSSGDIEFATATFEIQPRGYVYGSYQHGVKSMTLNTALDFTFNSSGKGGVFAWPLSYGNLVDGMSGVYTGLAS